jgi:beta-ribofuranosylaminobenzene 5'-phosphate synthase
MKIRTPSRIHITLIDLNGAIGRIDGGVGLALEEPFVEIKARKSDEITILGSGFNTDRFRVVAEKMRELGGGGIEIEVLSSYQSHVGLGSGTQISLAVGKAYSELYGMNLTTRQIAEIVGRGGTSGIGIAAFEAGGFVIDGGHSRKEKKSFLPSSASRAKPAPIIARHSFPDWDVVLAIPDLRGFYGGREVNLFQENCPIPLEDVRELSHIILMKLLPSVVEADLDEFSKAIARIQQLGFKKVEIDQYDDLIRECIEIVECAGMSSTGPTVYAVTDSNARDVARDFERYFAERGYSCETIITGARNRGADIEV